MENPVFTVSELNTLIKDVLENIPPLRAVRVKGEISNITLHRTGHIYFTLKDETSLLKAVMFRADAEDLSFTPKNGDKVCVDGRISVFVRDGVYQLYATAMELDGVGSLYVKFEMLKAKLEKEGLFDSSHKKRLPSVPFSIGIVTAPTGAAIRDMINISGRRFPKCKIVLYPSLVQGADAANDIIKGIEFFNNENSVELIVIGRGGGSIEDLWAFNDEKLAYAIYNSRLPVVSAVGHETDFTIADFVSDLRAPTPSAAMELALPDSGELLRKFDNVRKRISNSLTNKLDSERKLLKLLSSSRVFTDSKRMFEDRNLELMRVSDKMEQAVSRILSDKRQSLMTVEKLMKSYNPLGVLGRGYSVAYSADGKILKSEKQIKNGENFVLKLSDGDVKAIRNG